MRAGGFAAGTVLTGPRESHHDRQTARRIEAYRARRKAETNNEVLAAADRLDRPNASQHPLCAELRAIADAELDRRRLSLAPLAGGTR